MRPIDDIRVMLGEATRRLIVGEPEPRPLPNDGGLFGPDSVTWNVHADASMFVGGIRALLYQTVHPPTMAGVADHSDYRHDPLGRLQRTSTYVGTTTFGTAPEARQAIALVRRIHEKVQGTAPSGSPYRANDPHLLGWVHATEVDSFLSAKLAFGRERLSGSDADRYVEEMAVVADLIGVLDPPTSTRELAETLAAYGPELAVNHQSRAAVRFLAFPPLSPVLRGPYAVLFGGAVSLLPKRVRAMMWLPKLPITEAVAVRPAALTMTRILDWGMTGAAEAASAEIGSDQGGSTT